LSPSEEEYSAARAALTEAGFSEASISRCLTKPKRAYTKDSNWKKEAKAIYAETGVITRSQIMSTKGFPASSNPSQTVGRFIKSLENELGYTLHKQRDTWSKAVDNTEHIDLLLSKMPMTKQSFEKYCSDKGLDAITIKSTLKERGITVLASGKMEALV